MAEMGAMPAGSGRKRLVRFRTWEGKERTQALAFHTDMMTGGCEGFVWVRWNSSRLKSMISMDAFFNLMRFS